MKRRKLILINHSFIPHEARGFFLTIPRSRDRFASRNARFSKGRLFFSFGSPALRKSKVFESIRSNNYSKRLYASRLVRVSQSVARTTRTPTTSSYYLLQRFSFPPRGGDNPSRRGRFKMLARVGASRATEATSRGKKAFKESFPARVLFVSTPVTRGANDAAVAS